MRSRGFLILAIITLLFGSGITCAVAAATHLQPKVGWSAYQLAAFPDALDQSVLAGTEALEPLTLATADFDGDRVPDLLVGYGHQEQGVLVLHRGNIDCYRPNSQEGLKHRSEGTWLDAPFLSPPRVFELSSKPEFLLAGDFTGDFQSDVVFGFRNDNRLLLLPGDGQGSFRPEEYLEVPGSITAVASGEVGRRDGHEDLLVGIDAASGPQLYLFQSIEGAFSAEPAVLDIPDRAEEIIVGQFIGDYPLDLAVAANEYLVIVEGRNELLEGKFDTDQIDEYSFSSAITDLEVGDFAGNSQEELAVLTADGYLTYLEIGEEDVHERASTRIHHSSLPFKTQRVHLLRSRISTGAQDDLAIVDHQIREVRLITLEGNAASNFLEPQSKTLFSRIEPAAVLPAQLNLDGLTDLVSLNQNNSLLNIAMTSPLGESYTVNQPGTEVDRNVGDGRCDIDTNDANGQQCTFRAAIMEANADPGKDTINFAVEGGEATALGTTITQPVIIYGNGQTLKRPESGGNSYLAVQGGDSVISGLTLHDIALSISQKGVIEVSDSVVDRGIKIDGVSNVTISNSTILGPTGYGIEIVSGSGDITKMVGIVIDNNSITSCPMAGIKDGDRVQNQGSTSLKVTNNTIDGNGDGLRIAGKGALIQKNFIGTELAGNTKNGVLLYGDSAQILNNIIKFNADGGVWILTSVENTIKENTFEGNSSAGIGFSGSNSLPNYNVIQKNTFVNNIGWGVSHLNSDGLEVEENSFIGNYGGLDLGGRNAAVKKNWIGITKEGEILGNKRAGVSVRGIGNEVTDNTIAYNGTPPNSPGETGSYAKGYGSGVEIQWGATNNTISENRIFANVGASKDEVGYSQGLGIDVGGNGVTPNDSEENDGAQNYPELTVTGGGEVAVSLQSTSNSTFRIELFSNESCDDTGYGEGAKFLKEIDLTTNAQGEAQGTFSTTELYVTATATITECPSPCPDSQLFSTSEFSRCAATRETIVVNSTADDPLASGASECKTANGECTLRAAIQFANRDSNQDKITFDIGGAEPHVIHPGSDLPTIEHPTLIDGSDLDGDVCRPTVGIEGKQQGPGLRLEGKGCIVKGLAIYNFENGVVLAGEGEHKVQCNYIGTNLTGEADGSGNKSSGIDIVSSDNQIGGSSVKDRNIISGNGYCGVHINDKDRNVVQGNFIGTNVAGTKAIPNEEGVAVWGDQDPYPDLGIDNLIGGPTAVLGQPPGNLVSGNKKVGIRIKEAETDIQGNIVGADWTGRKTLPNKIGIDLDWGANSQLGGPDSTKGNLISGNKIGVKIGLHDDNKDYHSSIQVRNNLIGSDISGAWTLGNSVGVFIGGATRGSASIGSDSWGTLGLGNTIAFNGVGVFNWTFREDHYYTGVRISQNRIFDNGVGIIVSPQQKLVRPRLESAVLVQAPSESSQSGKSPQGQQGKLTISGLLGEVLNGGTVEFFSNLTCMDTGRGQGERYLGKTETDDKFEFQIDDPELIGSIITATFTEEEATSEFSNCVLVTTINQEGGKLKHKGNTFNLTLSAGAKVKSVTTKSSIEYKNPPPGTIFLLGFTSLVVSVEAGANQALGLEVSPVADSVTVTLEPPEGMEFDTYYNYGPTPDNPEPHWYEFLYDGSTGAEILEEQILIHLVDGQRGDHDLMVNGEIVTLGGPAVMGTTLYFPYNQVTEGSFVGFAVSNLSDKEAILNYRAFSEEGDLPDSILEDEILSLQPGHQLARLGTDIFDRDSGDLDPQLIDLVAEIGEIDPSELKPEKDERSWVELTSSETEIGSFFQLGTWDLSQQDGSVAFEEQSKKLYFTRVYEGETGYRGQPVSTYLSIANPNGEEIELSLTLHRLAGGSSPTATRTIAAKGFLYESISEIFGAGTEVAGGYVEVTVTTGDGAIGFEMIQMENQDTVIGLNASFGNEASEAYSAQLASLSVLYTSVNLINTGSQSRQLTLTGINSDGTNLTTPVSVTLAPGEQYSRDAGEIFGNGTQAQSEFVGSLKVEADGAGVIGDVIFGESLQLDYAAALPLQTEPFTEAVFNQVANIPGVFFTGLAFYNPGSVAASIDLQVVSADGTLVGEVTKVVEAGQRISPLVPELVPASQGQAGGYVLLKSDKPIIAQLIFGALRPNGTISLFSAVPPTVLE